MRIVSGSTEPGNTNWINYSQNGIYLDVDTSSAGFQNTPVYITSIGGRSNHWTTMGATSIYNATPTGFRVYVYKNINLTPAYANQKQWHINWVAFGD